MDLLRTLASDHREIKSLMKRIEMTTERGVKTRERLFSEFKQLLTSHAKSEEAVLYDRLRQENGEIKEQALESYEEHHVANLLLKELQSLSKSDERWGAKFCVLKESLEHHILEEEKTLFKMARKVLDREELNEMNEQFCALQEAHLAGFGAPARFVRKTAQRLAG